MLSPFPTRGDTDWTIRRGFYYTDNKGVRRKGDFLIFEPLHGLLVLEVKGHRFRQFAPTGAWEGDPEKNCDQRVDRLDQEHAGVIRALDEASPGWHPVAKALCLPNEFIPEGQTSFRDIPRDQLVDRRDLDRLESLFGRFFGGQQPRDLSRHREVFLKVYGKGSAPGELRHFLDHNEILFRKQLTRQYQLLDILEGNRQLLIEGGAGTGKTWNAVEQAVRLAEEGEGANRSKLNWRFGSHETGRHSGQHGFRCHPETLKNKPRYSAGMLPREKASKLARSARSEWNPRGNHRSARSAPHDRGNR